MDLKARPARRPPEAGCVDIWHFQCEPPSPASTEALAWTLSERERVTAGRIRGTAQRLRYIASHVTTRAILASYSPGAATAIVLETGRHGKPYVAAPDAATQVQFSMAHSGTLCVVAVTADQEVGVDVERVRRDIALNEIARMYFTPRELAALRLVPEESQAEAFFACWTRKEALLKAHGTGFLRPPQSIDAGLGAHDPSSDLRCGDWTVTELDLPHGYAGAVAVKGRRRIRVLVREWLLSP
jgi:4'-phosphopantetheinyl transferase